LSGGAAVGLIWAQGGDGRIAAGGRVPWHVPEDLERFRLVTLGRAVVMGRATWDALPARARPLTGRVNLVLSRTPGRTLPGAQVVAGVPEAFAAARAAGSPPPVWVIGGEQIFRLFEPFAELAEVTLVDGRGRHRATAEDATAFAPALGADWKLTRREPAAGWLTSVSGARYRFETWARGEPV
jgi:dihydrofolate reductase